MTMPRPLANPPRLEMLIIALPFIFCLYPAIALLATGSEIPIFFNLYSRDLLLLNTIMVLSYVTVLAAFWLNWRGLQFATVLTVSLLMLIATNNAMRDFPGFDATTQLVRFTGGLSLIVISFLANKQERSRWSGIGLGIGAIVLLTALIDFSFSFAGQLLPADKQNQIYGRYRTAMDFSKVTEEDIVLVGDSFVWGAGVPVELRFGDVLERKLGGAQGPRVYSLGIVGAGIGEYNRQILDIPVGNRARRVIVFFYANDMPPRVNLRDSIERVGVIVGQRSITARALADIVRFAITPSPDVYARALLDSFAEDDGTFGFRWSLLTDSLQTLHQRAVERSRESPTLIILPMLVDFDVASFDKPHRRVAELAEKIGFRVLDTTPTFRSTGQKAEHFRAASNDLHLNERGNAIVADILMGIIKAVPAGASP
jgi:GDSL-like Lipase/Acylhydrolase family